MSITDPAAPDPAHWVGREQLAHDTITERLVREFRATLAPHLAEADPDVAPLLIHWCLAPPAAPMVELGEDGHPARGGFLPPVPLPRRMWAAGRLTFHDDLRPGDEVRRRSTVTSVERKAGRSGDLWFVEVGHRLETGRGLALEETQTIVYREAGAKSPEPPEPTVESGAGDVAVEFSAVRLFRYSALTFNGHRIHYDRPYATGVEGYDGLVVHGPLQATLLAHAAARSAGTRLKTFRFRGVSPLIGPGGGTIRAVNRDGEIRCCMCSGSGAMTMDAQAT